MPSEISNETSCIELIYSFTPSEQWLEPRDTIFLQAVTVILQEEKEEGEERVAWA